jgi:hypothetical protein
MGNSSKWRGSFPSFDVRMVSRFLVPLLFFMAPGALRSTLAGDPDENLSLDLQLYQFLSGFKASIFSEHSPLLTRNLPRL